VASRRLVEIDVPALKRILRNSGCDSLEEASVSLFGRSRSYLTTVIRRGKCTVETLDAIAGKIDCHMSEIAGSDLYIEEDWPEDLD
jgi:hypothetical protein